MSKIIRNLDDYIQKLEEIVNIDSGTINTEGVTKVARTLKGYFEDAGFYAQTVFLDESVGEGVFATNAPDAKEYDVLLVGHIDTVFAKGECEKRPFTVKDNLAFGPGVSDMKSGDLIILWAISKLKKETLNKVKIAICLNPDEETGSTKSSEWIDSYAKRCRYALIYEGQRMLGEYTSTRKGISHIDITLKGVGAHAGFCPEKGRSAINAMAQCIIRLNALANENVTVNFGVIKGGTIANAIAEECTARIDVRFWTQEQCNDFFEKFKAEFEKPFGPDIKAEYKILLINPAMEESEKTQDLKDRITSLGKKLGITSTFIKSGGVSDGNHISQTRIPVIDGLGGVGGDAHTTREWLDLTSVETKTDLTVSFIESLS
ncbi:MAG: M20 family metallopeptidase [Aeromonadales bacterium]|nr:M20 family metallopeptidase [Aeromonadales bacterium]